MNTSSPAPMRRRRPAREAQDTREAPILPDGYAQDAPPSRSASRARSSQSSRGSRSSGALLATLPTPVRLLLIFLCSAIFFTSVVAVTRDYLARQEERRRLEAEAAERAQHPLLHPELIEQYAAAQGLDPALVAAIVLCESSFDARAESRLGARGLMQLMEDTASWIAHRLGEDGADYSFDLLYDPSVNIRFGTWYLGYLSQRFSGDETKIVCAYHAGQGNVDKWLANPDYSSDGVTLEVIPTEDTATYASRVLRARDVYRKYYYPEDAESSVVPVD